MKRDVTLFLNDIIDAIRSIETFIKGMSKEEFKKDDKTMSAVIRKLEIIGEAVKNVPGDILAAYPEIPWSYMAKMRDRLIHAYFDSDPDIVWNTARKDLPGIPSQIAIVISALKT